MSEQFSADQVMQLRQQRAKKKAETVAIAMWQAEGIRMTGKARAIEWRDEKERTRVIWSDLAVVAIAAASRFEDEIK